MRAAQVAVSGGLTMAMGVSWSLEADIDAAVDRCAEIWPALAGGHLFVTGGTGFIGCWMLETLCRANDRLGTNIRATVLTRSPERFAAKVPHLAGHPLVDTLRGDVCDFDADGGYTHIVHAATDASADLNERDPLRMFDTVLAGTRRVLDFAVRKGIVRVLYLSSGAAYGNQPWEMERVEEAYRGGPDCLNPRAAYAEAKRAAEMLCAIFSKQFGLQVPIARIFALLGPYLSLDIHFAAGNFINNAMRGQPIVVQGNGLPERSYLYAGDLAVMLWHMLVRARSLEPYNLGSDESISIAELARLVGNVLGQPDIRILGAQDLGWNLGRYVPDTRKIAVDLGLERTVCLKDSILRTAWWHGWKAQQ
jgi:nucleoside-diphosphate-sugar epimerase